MLADFLEFLIRGSNLIYSCSLRVRMLNAIVLPFDFEWF